MQPLDAAAAAAVPEDRGLDPCRYPDRRVRTRSPAPIGRELADFFGVARMTVRQAIRVLREEGFVTSPGQRRVRQPAARRSRERLPRSCPPGVADFLHEMGQLKRFPRTGWQFAGVPHPESVAEHCYRVAIVGIALAIRRRRRRPHRGTLHPSRLTESRIGDVPAVGRAYVTTASPRRSASTRPPACPTSSPRVPGAVRLRGRGVDRGAPAHDADKLETLLQAREYEAQAHHDTLRWQDSSLVALRTDAAKQLAHAILATTPTTVVVRLREVRTELRKEVCPTRDTRSRPSTTPRVDRPERRAVLRDRPAARLSAALLSVLRCGFRPRCDSGRWSSSLRSGARVCRPHAYAPDATGPAKWRSRWSSVAKAARRPWRRLLLSLGAEVGGPAWLVRRPLAGRGQHG